MASTEAHVSVAEAEFIAAGCAGGLRGDGRACLDRRYAHLRLGELYHASGSAELRVGGTTVTAAVCAQIGSPPADRPRDGRVDVHVEAGGARASFDAARLQRSLLQLLAPKGCGLRLDQLCIVEGEQCWELLISLHVQHADGALLDASSLAVAAALADTRLPRVSAAPDEGGGEKTAFELDEDLTESTALDTRGVPLFCTVAMIGGARVVDCTAQEERCASSSVSIGTNADGAIVTIVTAGPESVPREELKLVLRDGCAHAAAVHASLRAELEKRQAPASVGNGRAVS